jgi:hypothetical protein
MKKDVGSSGLPGVGRIDAHVTAIGKPMPRTVVSHITKNARFVPPSGRVSFQAAVVERVDFRDTWWDDFWAAGTVFVDCDFRGSRFGHAVLGDVSRQTTYRRCKFDGADLRNTRPGAARFEECQFAGAKIEDWRCFLNEFVACRFAGKLDGVGFSGRPWGPGAEKLRPKRRTNEFRGNDFREVDLIQCSFKRGIDISLQLWPEKDTYIRLDRARERVAKAREVLAGWSDQEARRLGLIMLQVYSSFGYEEQEEIFARRDDLDDTIPRDLSDRVWSLLKSL